MLSAQDNEIRHRVGGYPQAPAEGPRAAL